jgi:tRNA(Arg) A34 adenosine deaminase TadA
VSEEMPCQFCLEIYQTDLGEASVKPLSFEEKVIRNIKRLQHIPYHVLENEVAQKRLDWFRQHQQQFTDRFPSPRTAYEMFFFEYLALRPEDVPVLSETEHKIEWSSLNRCSTLEACKQAGLDTRKVCRSVFEKSTQALISQLDTQLRFYRSYEEIRPYSHHCKEGIVRIDFEQMMRVALEEAHQSKAEGDKGYGAVVVSKNGIVGRAHDITITANDPSLHAEVNAIRQAVQTSGDGDLCGAILFSTCEPCPMCATLAIRANITTIVYGVSIEDTVRLGRTRIQVSGCSVNIQRHQNMSGDLQRSLRELVEKSPVMIEIIGDVLKEECQQLYV